MQFTVHSRPMMDHTYVYILHAAHTSPREIMQISESMITCICVCFVVSTHQNIHLSCFNCHLICIDIMVCNYFSQYVLWISMYQPVQSSATVWKYSLVLQYFSFLSTFFQVPHSYIPVACACFWNIHSCTSGAKSRVSGTFPNIH